MSAWRSRGDRRKEGLYLQLSILNKGIGLVSPQEWIKVEAEVDRQIAHR